MPVLRLYVKLGWNISGSESCLFELVISERKLDGYCRMKVRVCSGKCGECLWCDLGVTGGVELYKEKGEKM